MLPVAGENSVSLWGGGGCSALLVAFAISELVARDVSGMRVIGEYHVSTGKKEPPGKETLLETYRYVTRRERKSLARQKKYIKAIGTRNYSGLHRPGWGPGGFFRIRQAVVHVGTDRAVAGWFFGTGLLGGRKR